MKRTRLYINEHIDFTNDSNISNILINALVDGSTSFLLLIVDEYIYFVCCFIFLCRIRASPKFYFNCINKSENIYIYMHLIT